MSIQVSERNGPVIGACIVAPEGRAMFTTSDGTPILTRVKKIPVVGRNTQGVRLIDPDEGEYLASLDRIAEAQV